MQVVIHNEVGWTCEANNTSMSLTLKVWWTRESKKHGNAIKNEVGWICEAKDHITIIDRRLGGLVKLTKS
jgi:hypothetical protein